MKYVDVHTTNLEKKTNSELKRIADYWFRQVLLFRAVRNKDNDIFCPLYKKWFPESQMHVCHYIDRIRPALRYSPKNCYLCCAKSNIQDSKIPFEGHKSKHHMMFEDFLGEEVVEELKQEARTSFRVDKWFYIDKIEMYRREITKNETQ